MYKISYVEKQGEYHKYYDIPCQDKVAYVKGDDFACVALADGAGSKRFSHIGAELTVKVICDYFTKNDTLNVEKLFAQIEEKLRNCDYVFEDLASTLLFVYVNKDKAIIGHLGDGMIIDVINNYAEVLSYPENGENKNITYFTTDSNAKEKFVEKVMSLKDIDNVTFLLTSDGGEALLYNSKTNTVANAVSIMADWLNTGDEEEINEALEINIEELSKIYTSDDVSIILLQVKK